MGQKCSLKNLTFLLQLLQFIYNTITVQVQVVLLPAHLQPSGQYSRPVADGPKPQGDLILTGEFSFLKTGVLWCFWLMYSHVIKRSARLSFTAEAN